MTRGKLDVASATEPPVETATDGLVPELVYVESSESDAEVVDEESELVFTETEVDGVATFEVVTVASVVGELGGFALEAGGEAGAEEPLGGLATWTGADEPGPV